MMRLAGWVVCSLVILCCFASYAGATGYGFYTSVGSGSADWKDDGFSAKFDTDHIGGGFVMDTEVATNTLLNYQLNIGYDQFTNKVKSSGEKVKLSGLMVSNDFGFGIIRTPSFRLWFGPEVMLAWQQGSKNSVDYDSFGYGLGPVVGMNFNLPGTITLALKGGYQFMKYSVDASTDFASNDFKIDEKMYYVTISVLFRSPDDSYSSRNRQRKYRSNFR